MKKHIQEIFWWAILGIPLILSILAFRLDYIASGFYLLGTAICLTGFCWIRSYTERGPAAQLPNNTGLRLRSGQGTYIGFYANGKNKAVDERGEITDDDGQYQEELYSGLSGLVLLLTGMVVTIVGIKGVYVRQTKLDHEQDEEDGSVSAKEVEIPELSGYKHAIPLFIRRGLAYGGIPIKDKNLVNLGMEGTIEVTNLDDLTTKFDDEDIEMNMNALKGTLESTLRPKIEGRTLKQVQQLRSEYHSTKKKKITKKEREASPVLQAIYEANVATSVKYRYGIKVQDLDIPILAPADKDYAKAQRAKGLAIATAEAATIKFENDRDKGLAEAEVLKAKNAAAKASGQPAMALFSEGMKGLRPGVTFAPGMAIMPFAMPSATAGSVTEEEPTTSNP